METVQASPDTEAQPLQPPNVDPLAGVAVRVTELPIAKLALQVEPQLIPAGLDVTFPEPVPLLVTVSQYLFNVNDAVTDRAAVI